MRVRLEGEGDGLRLTVEDDGRGFAPAEAVARPGCFGLAGMGERAQRIGAEFEVDSAPGRGTCIYLHLEGGRS